MLYLRLCLDKPHSQSLRDEHRPGHRAYLASAADKIVQAGPLLAEDGSMVGSMIILEAGSLREVEAFHEGDPFTSVGLFETVKLVRWDRHIG